ncbi:reverse transcriptase family protein [Burkholderia ambifaria]|uniref:reverse transcriptase family protein n=1 Tax=Burkholderia ambifaria TaxID=152480 RepID=UPI000F7FB175|nr:reverse transcriptase family protein [Burkholderia ambifaria]
MNQSTTNCPSYDAKPIRLITSLAKALETDENQLLLLADEANELYRIAKKIRKPDGSLRRTYDALPRLKDIQRRIKFRILDRVTFPSYLTGSLKGRDYKVNAALHSGAKILIAEDIGSFFPSTSASRVFDIWKNFFGFGHEVACCLTKLTTLRNELPQGAITSAHLANLVFWREEPQLRTRLDQSGIVYSRFVDDVAVSSRSVIEPAQKTEVVTSIYGMMIRHGYRPKRTKHELHTARNRMVVTKLTVNAKPGLEKTERSKIRAMVHELERLSESLDNTQAILDRLNSVAGKINMLGRFHPGKAQSLKKRLLEVKQIIAAR